jgi:hypothetical protein
MSVRPSFPSAEIRTAEGAFRALQGFVKDPSLPAGME